MTENALTTRAQQMHGPQRYVPPDAHFPVSELFTSVQGEGKLTGVRSHFIRLNGCNLRCRWCDTPYASWDAAKEPQAQNHAEQRPAPEAPTTSRVASSSPNSPTAASLPVLHDGARIRLADLVASARASGAEHVVITGGEPLIFPGIGELSHALMAAGLHVTIETAGTVLPRVIERAEPRTENRDQEPGSHKPAVSDFRFQISDLVLRQHSRSDQRADDAAPASADTRAERSGRPAPTPAARASNTQPPDARAFGLPSAPLCSLISLSPKLASSTPLPGDPRDPTGAWRRRHEQRRLNLPAMQALLDAAPDRQIKFVITSPDDLPEIESVLDRLTGWQPTDIFLMPEGVTPPPPATVRWITAAAARRGWQYGRRLHIELFGNTRGT